MNYGVDMLVTASRHGVRSTIACRQVGITLGGMPTASHQRLGTNRRRAPGGGRHPKLTLADQITATLLHQHLALPTAVLARLLGVSKDTARHAVNQTQQLLNQHGFTPPPPAAHLTTLAGLSLYATARGIHPTTKNKPAC